MSPRAEEYNLEIEFIKFNLSGLHFCNIILKFIFISIFQL